MAGRHMVAMSGAAIAAFVAMMLLIEANAMVARTDKPHRELQGMDVFESENQFDKAAAFYVRHQRRNKARARTRQMLARGDRFGNRLGAEEGQVESTSHPMIMCVSREYFERKVDASTVRVMDRSKTETCFVVAEEHATKELLANAHSRSVIPVEARIAPDALAAMNTWLKLVADEEMGDEQLEDEMLARVDTRREIIVHGTSQMPLTDMQSWAAHLSRAEAQVTNLDALQRDMYWFSSEHDGSAPATVSFGAQQGTIKVAPAFAEEENVYVKSIQTLHTAASAVRNSRSSARSQQVDMAPMCNFEDMTTSITRRGELKLEFMPYRFADAANDVRDAVCAAFADGRGRELSPASCALTHATACAAFLTAQVAAMPQVYIVELIPELKKHNYRRSIVQSGSYPGDETIWDAGLRGQDMLVGCADTGVDTDSCFFSNNSGSEVERSNWWNPVTDWSQRKVVQYVHYSDGEDEDSGHGTHVAGTIMGKSMSSFTGDSGAADYARMAFFDIGNTTTELLEVPWDYSVIFDPAYWAGARVHSNSWGSDSPYYTSGAATVDEYMYNHTDMLILFAAGNCGEPGSCWWWGNESVGSPASFKNGVAVGASESGDDSWYGANQGSIDNVAGFSSQGPSLDGRILPHIVAPGYWTWSANAGSTCAMYGTAGTSMATPLVAGNALLIQQYFRDGWYPYGNKGDSEGWFPTASLVKSVILNCGQSITYYNSSSAEYAASLGSAPDNYQGWGRLWMDSCLPLNGSFNSYAVNNQTIWEDQEHYYLFDVTDESMNISFTMCFTEPAGTPYDSSPTINDLDLKIQQWGSTSQTLYPNGGWSADELNSCEKIVVSDVAAGDQVLVTVQGSSVWSEQSYSLHGAGHVALNTTGSGAFNSTDDDGDDAGSDDSGDDDDDDSGYYTAGYWVVASEDSEGLLGGAYSTFLGEYSLSDDDTVWVSVPFDVQLFGRNFGDSMEISSNGIMSPDGLPSSGCCSGDDMEDTSFEYAIALSWTDLNPSSSGSIYAGQVNNFFMVVFEDVAYYSGGETVTAEFALFENGSMLINVLDASNYSSDVTIGISGRSGTGINLFGPDLNHGDTTNSLWTLVPGSFDDDSSDNKDDEDDVLDVIEDVAETVGDVQCDGSCTCVNLLFGFQAFTLAATGAAVLLKG